MLATMLSPSAGTATVDGANIIKDGEKVRAQMGLLFGGDTGLYDRLTARENIVYFARLSDIPDPQANAQAQELAHAFNFTEYLDFPAKKLSKGTRQKVALARSVAHNPSCMLFDEPMVGLDVTSRKDVQDFVLTLKDRRKTVILSDHNLNVIERLCDRVAILHEGTLCACDTIENLCRSHECEDLEAVFFKLAGRE
jgi:sodium transport system ATP-binding protein